MATIQHTCPCGARWSNKESPSWCGNCGKQSYGSFIRDTAKPQKKSRREEDDGIMGNPNTYDYELRGADQD